LKMKLPAKVVLFLMCGSACSLLAQSLATEQTAAAPVQAQAAQLAANAHREDYVIGSEDVLAVNIWKEPEISRTVPVRPDGKITLPLIGDVQASGLTPRKLQDNIAQGLRSYVSSPDVTVIVQEVKSLKFNVVGEIAKPGSYTLTEPMTVLDAIAVGGGLRDFAKGGSIYVLRSNQDGSHSKLPFDYKQVIKGKKLSQNVELRSGDTIVIP
jgi:polysaccharide biosynthesis/export protein